MSPRLHDDVSYTTTDFGTVLLDERNGRYFHLGTTAAVIIESLAAGHGVEGAARLVSERFDVAAERARDDIHALLGSLAEKGLLGP